MEPSSQGQGTNPQPPSPIPCVGRYIYCIARTRERVDLGTIGIEGRQVYTIGHEGLGAAVHDCVAQSYQSDDPEVLAAWALAHHRVVDAAWERWGAVLPLAFNTIIRGGPGSPEENLVKWLAAVQAPLQAKLEAVAGNAEYGVQVFWDPQMIAKKLADASPDLRELEEAISGKARGTAYMYRQKLESLLRREMEARAREDFASLRGRLSACVANLRAEKLKPGTGGLQMVANLSCLVPLGGVEELKASLAEMGGREGYLVRLAGPFPPYSFC